PKVTSPYRSTISGSAQRVYGHYALWYFHTPLSRAAAEPGAPGADRGIRIRGRGSVRDAQPLRLSRAGGDCAAGGVAEGNRAGAARHSRADHESAPAGRSVG